MPDAEQLRRPLDFLFNLAVRNALRPQRKGDILAHRVMRIEAVALEHHRHAAGARRNIVDDIAADQEVAAGLLFEPADDAEERRLAAARRSQQHHELSVRHRQTNAVHGGNFIKFLDDIPGQYRSHQVPPEFNTTHPPRPISLGGTSFVSAPFSSRPVAPGMIRTAREKRTRSGRQRSGRPLLEYGLALLRGPLDQIFGAHRTRCCLRQHVGDGEVIVDFVNGGRSRPRIAGNGGPPF